MDNSDVEKNNEKKKTGTGRRIRNFIIYAFVLSILYVVGIYGLSDRIVRISFNGLQNFLNTHVDYYAIAGPFSARIPKVLAQIPFKSDIENIGNHDEESGRVFWVSVDWSEECRPNFTSWERFMISHNHSEHYIILANPADAPSGSEVPATPEEEKIILDIAEHFYDFDKEFNPDTDKCNAISNGNWTTVSFSVYINGDKCSFCIEQPDKEAVVYSYNKKGLIKFYKHVKVPSRGHFDTIMFK